MVPGSIPHSTIEEVKERVDLAELISSYGVQLKPSSGGFVACCPFHHEKTPSFRINQDKGFYHCFGCGKSGTAIDFLMEYGGMGFVDAVMKLGEITGVKIDVKEDPEAGMRQRLFSLHEELAAFFHRCLVKSKEAEVARKYLASRKLDGEAAELFTIGYVPIDSAAMLKWAEKYGYKAEELEKAGVLLPPKYPGGRWYNRFAGRLIFTIRDKQGRAVAFSARNILDPDNKKIAKYVNSPETPIFKKSHVLFAFDKAAGAITRASRREAIVCEGQIDVIRCHMNGFKTAVASQGTSFTDDHAAMLSKNADSVVLVFDADGAGRKAAVKTARLFLARGIPVRVASLPKGEDPDSLLLKAGPSAFQACLDAAESIIAFQIRIMREDEASPGTIDAISRISKAVLETAASCLSSVMRSALLEEASKIMSIPVSALEEDFGRMDRQKPPPTSPPQEPQPEDGPPPEFFFGEGEDAGAPSVNPPPPRELALCELVFANTGDAEIMSIVDECIPDAILSHPFTRMFMGAWRAASQGDAGAMGVLRRSLDGPMCKMLDGILLGTDRAGLSELGPERVLRDMARQLWCDELKRRQLLLPAESTPENDAKRLGYSQSIRAMMRLKWDKFRDFAIAMSDGR